jgi:hypothetical protein
MSANTMMKTIQNNENIVSKAGNCSRLISYEVLLRIFKTCACYKLGMAKYIENLRVTMEMSDISCVFVYVWNS